MDADNFHVDRWLDEIFFFSDLKGTNNTMFIMAKVILK